MAVSRAAVVPGPRGVNRVDYQRAAPRVWEVPAPPLPMRPGWGPAPAPAPTKHQRILAVVTPRQKHAGGRPREAVTVRGTQLLLARALERLAGREIGQRLLAEKCACSRSAIAEAERGVRPVLPSVAEWVETILRHHGAWLEPEEATP